MTFAGAGAALSCPGRVLVLEGKALPGYEFLDCMHPAPDLSEKRTGLAEALRAVFEEAGLADRPFTPGWTPYFSKFLLERNCPVQFFTDVTDISRAEGIYALTVCQNGEKSIRYAKRVIDTRTAEPAEAFLHGGIFGDAGLSDFGGFSFLSCESNIYNASLCREGSESLSDARRRFFALWKNRPADLEKYRILTVADAFAFRSGYGERTLENGVISLPSDNSADLFDAVSRGERMGGEEK